MSSSNSVVSDRALFPIMLEIAGLIGSLIGFFFSMYYINKRGLDGALDIGTYWVVDSICLPFGFAGLFFEETFQEKKKRYSICTKESSSIFFAFGITMFILHHGKFSLDAKVAITFCFFVYLLFSSLSLLLELIRNKEYTRFKLIHLGLCFCVIAYSTYFGIRFLL